MRHTVSRRLRVLRGWAAATALLLGSLAPTAVPNPYVPANDNEVLANLPAGTSYGGPSTRQRASFRLDVALPLAQFYITQARVTGDLRFLGYAEATLQPWRNVTPKIPAVLVLHATILQSRHAFAEALQELDSALETQPSDSQAWLTRATILRVVGRYPEAAASCQHIAAADPSIAALCIQSVDALRGRLLLAYQAIQALPLAALADEARAWRYSELGEIAERLGKERDSAHWFVEALQLAPEDAYTRAAYADLLLSEGRAAETLQLLQGYESMEPLLLRSALAQRLLRDPALTHSCERLESAFTVEEERGEAVHRREQARFLLDLRNNPQAALEAATKNWEIQREPSDALVLLRAAAASHHLDAAARVAQFLRQQGTEDVRLDPYLKALQ